MRSLLIVLSITLMPLFLDPARAQTAADDQYGSSGVGSDAATDALRASRTFDDAPGAEAAISEQGTAYAAEEGVAIAAEESATVAAEAATALSDAEAASAEEGMEAEATDSEKVSGEVAAIDSLPDTGGISVVLLGGLLVAGGVLIRALAR